MHLTPSDTEKLLLSVAGMIARDRLARGVRLNYPEAVALLSCWVIEEARAGGTVGRRKRTATQACNRGIELRHAKPQAGIGGGHAGATGVVKVQADLKLRPLVADRPDQTLRY